MNSHLFQRPSIEPLEARIAPALLVNGANLLGGAGNPNTGETSVGANSLTLVKVLSGQALVWFDDGHINSISFGPNTNLEIHGDLLGDVVGNLTAAGTLSDSDDKPSNGEDGARLLANNLLGLKVLPISGEAGSVGRVITGGSISGLAISGDLLGAYAGDGAFHDDSKVLVNGKVSSSVGALDINPVASGTQSTFDFIQQDGLFQAGASIKNAKIARAPALQMIAGSGNPTGVTLTLAGPAGGGISGITIESAFVPSGAPTATPSYWLIAGAGADGKSGGAGGSIDHIIEKSSFGPVKITGGLGGTGSGGAGGAGGSVSYLELQSNSAHYTVNAGNGGDGAPAGNGGRLLNNNFSNRTPVSGIIVAADFTGDGVDDILVVDAATGQMIIDTQDDPDPTNGIADPIDSQFHQLVQFTNTSAAKVVLIDSAGLSPVDAVASDVNGDGKLDIVVAYKNSGGLAVYLNQGNGVFFDPSLGTVGKFAAATVDLGFSPAKIATNGPGGGVLAVAENQAGKGIMHFGVWGGSTVDDLKLELAKGSNEFAQPVADLVFGDGQFIAAFSNGVLSKLQPLGLESPKAFIVTETGVAIAGGISDLEVDSSGQRLLALSTVAHTVTVFDLTTPALAVLSTIALGAGATPLVAHFTHDADGTTEDDIAVLSLLPGGSRITSYKQAVDADPTTVDPFNVSGTLNTVTALKNFTPVYASGNFSSDAALAGSMNSFIVTPDLVSSTEYALPFASKIIELTAGNGGDGLNFGTLIGKGGAGGGILGINADANELKLFSGDGGNSDSGAAGAGGSVINPLTFITAANAVIVPTLVADVVLEIGAGKGGTPNGPLAAKTATGGAGGSLSGLSITLDAGDITLATGEGGKGNGGAGGAGGSFTGVKTVAHDGNLTLSTGAGGEAQSGVVAGGAGGSITNFSHELSLQPDVELLEKKYFVNITTGVGGVSASGTGGAGGSLQGVTLKLDGSDRTYDDNGASPPKVDAHKDSTVRVSVTTGEGGEGANGGAGGMIRDFSHTSVFDQGTPGGGVYVNFVVMQLTAGVGGEGTAGNGGAGGGILLSRPISGVTAYDFDATVSPEATDPVNFEPFIAIAGKGGLGSLKGGAGGAITGLTLQNSSFSDGASIAGTHLLAAVVTAGAGGEGTSLDGGAGGAVSGALIGTQVGYLQVTAGKGGAGGLLGKGGAGGAVTGSTFGVVNTVASVGLAVAAGTGGDGTLGGGGGGLLSNLQVSTPQSTDGISAILRSGDGGKANAAGKLGGKGGDIIGISQGKDVNSSINLIQAGNGGDNLLGTAGAGGNISAIKTVGFIGRPSDGGTRLGVFDNIDTSLGLIEIPQGLFSGRGGQGALTKGVNGSVSSVTARQIAAIAAAVDSHGMFASAAKITNVKAALIGFDVNTDGMFDAGAGSPSPASVKAIDGFVFGDVVTQVTGTTAPTFLIPS